MTSTDINLDDVFAAIPITPLVSSVSHQRQESNVSVSNVSYTASHHSHSEVIMSRAPESRSNSIVSHRSSQHQASNHYNGVPEPKSRTSTIQSVVSKARTESNASTIKPPPVVAAQPASNDPLLDQIFSVVSLPDVEYHHPKYDERRYESEVIADLDDAIGNDSKSSHRERWTSHGSHYTDTTQGGHEIQTGVMSFDDETDDDRHTVSEHNYGGSQHSIHHSASEHEDGFGTFEVAQLPKTIGMKNPDLARYRSMTMDSLASVAESRYGGFDVHDDLGAMTGQNVNLQHNEVAYTRPKVKTNGVKAAAISHHQHSSNGDTLKLKKLTDEVNRARQKQLILEAQIAREKKEVEILKQRQPTKSASTVSVHTSVHSNNNSRPQSMQSFHERQSSVSENRRYSEDRPSSVMSKHTISGDSIYEEEVAVNEIAEREREHGTEVDFINDISIIVPLHESFNTNPKDPHVKKVIFGGHQETSIEDKTVLLFGPLGSGKTSAINSILNYLYGVKKENDFRFVTSNQNSPTKDLTAYVFNNTILPFSVTIVDTPGVPDQKGNTTVSTLIRHWFQNELLSAGAFRLDAISIVLTHDEDSLGWPFIHELAAVKRLFGDDLKTNVLPIITNSEVLPQPFAIRSLAQANIAFVEYYKVNNAGFFADAQGLTKLKHNLFFKHGEASLEAFFRDLQELIHPLLAVLRNRTPRVSKTPSTPFDPAALY